MKMFIKKFIAGLLINCLFPLATFAAMSSTNYTIYADSIGLDGGSLSTSTSYSLQDTAGEPVAGQVTSASYTLTGGYQAMDRGLISLDISNGAINLGQLSTQSINQASSVVTVSTDSSSGYTLSMGSVSGSMPTAVSDGAVTAGAEEYGVAASGSHSQIGGDMAITNGRIVASTNNPASADATTLTFKASMSGNSTAGSYSQIITLNAMANF